MPAERRAQRFVRAVIVSGAARLYGTEFVAVTDGRRATLRAADVASLVSAGVLTGGPRECRATPEATGWLKRQLLDADAFAAQHRLETETPAGHRLNLAESPLARLATAAGGEEPFLARQQVEAGERLRRLAARAQLLPRMTMSYSPAHAAGGGAQGAGDMADMAADARRALAELHRVLPRDCADVVLDLCVFEKGLQQIEGERGWPRRSAKLVLRIGLECLAAHFGLAAAAEGPAAARSRSWMGGERVAMFGTE